VTILSLSENPKVYKNVEQTFKLAINTGFQGFELPYLFTRRQKAHGREEIRHYLMLNNIDERVDPTHKWSNIKV